MSDAYWEAESRLRRANQTLRGVALEEYRRIEFPHETLAWVGRESVGVANAPTSKGRRRGRWAVRIRGALRTVVRAYRS